VNVDGSWNAWLSNHPFIRAGLETIGLIGRDQGARWNVRPLVHDLTKPLPFPEHSFSAVYASHVLEHLYLADAQRLLEECHRVLRSGGVIRVVVPDLRSMAITYIENKNGEGPLPIEKQAPADKFNEMLMFRGPAPPAGNFLYRIYTLWKDFHHHKWMYDSESLAHYVEKAGFSSVREKEFLQSEILGIADVEQANRLVNGAGVCVEGKKL
jgi:predicted SAM-dependent methyltransferase